MISQNLQTPEKSSTSLLFSKKMSLAFPMLLVGMFIVFVAITIFVSLYGVRQQQDARSQASEGVLFPPTKTALVVVGGKSKTVYSQGDTIIKRRLENLGFRVAIIHEENLVPTSVSKYNVIVLSSTVASTVANNLKTIPAPIIVLDDPSLPLLGMTENSTSSYGFAPFDGSLVIENSTHELAGGIKGSVTVLRNGNTQQNIMATSLNAHWGRPGNNSIVIASIRQVTNKKVIFGYEKNTQMATRIAPARRVSFFVDSSQVQYLTSSGWSLFDATVKWSSNATGSSPIPSATPKPSLVPSPSIAPTNTPTPTPTPIVTVPKSITWTQLADYSPPLEGYGKQEGQGGLLNGKLYLLGGYDNWYKGVQRSDVYEVATNTWSEIAPIPEKLNHASYIQDGDTLYLIGGFVGDNPSNNSTTHVWKYSISGNSWSAGVPLPASRGAGVAVKHGRNIHFVAGVFRANGIYDDKADHYIFNLDTQQWSTGKAIPTSRNHPGATIIGDKMYVIGGQVGHKEETGNIGVVESYDFITDTWERLPDMPTPRGHILASTLAKGPFVFVIGGSENGTPTSKSSSAVSVFDTRDNTWHVLTTLPMGRKSVVAGFDGEDLYVATGHGQGFAQKTTWRGKINY